MGSWDLGPNSRELGSWELSSCPDLKDLGLDARPKRVGFGRLTQENWFRTHDPRVVGTDAGLKRLGSLFDLRNLSPSPDLRVLGPDI